jgi:hypothetical protein
MFPFLDQFYLGREEQDLKANLTNYKGHLMKLIKSRQQEVKDPNFINKGDFLTLMV